MEYSPFHLLWRVEEEYSNVWVVVWFGYSLYLHQIPLLEECDLVAENRPRLQSDVASEWISMTVYRLMSNTSRHQALFIVFTLESWTARSLNPLTKRRHRSQLERSSWRFRSSRCILSMPWNVFALLTFGVLFSSGRDTLAEGQVLMGISRRAWLMRRGGWGKSVARLCLRCYELWGEIWKVVGLIDRAGKRCLLISKSSTFITLVP